MTGDLPGDAADAGVPASKVNLGIPKDLGVPAVVVVSACVLVGAAVLVVVVATQPGRGLTDGLLN